MVDLGVNSTQLTTISFGEENPAVRGSTESAWAKNRRDDFVLR
jgi:peptidoglycan-associated lipoprotein